jgi:hypothetical protein
MAKRITREEFDQRMKALRDAYLRDIDSATGDSGKVDVAAKKLSWGEEAARDAFNQRNGLYKFFDSIPLVGKPVTFILDNIEKGTAQHGRFWGLIRGLFVGLILAVTLVALSEGAAFLFEIGRSWINIHQTQPILAAQRAQADADAIKERDEHRIKLGQRAEVAKTSITYYLVNNNKDADIVSNKASPSSLIQFLDRSRYAYASAPLQTLQPDAQIVPFFFNNEARDVATVEFHGKKCVVASLDGNIIFIPLDAYKAANLPMHESAPDPTPAPEPVPR